MATTPGRSAPEQPELRHRLAAIEKRLVDTTVKLNHRDREAATAQATYLEAEARVRVLEELLNQRDEELEALRRNLSRMAADTRRRGPVGPRLTHPGSQERPTQARPPRPEAPRRSPPPPTARPAAPVPRAASPLGASTARPTGISMGSARPVAGPDPASTTGSARRVGASEAMTASETARRAAKPTMSAPSSPRVPAASSQPSVAPVGLGARKGTPTARTAAGASFDNSTGKMWSARKEPAEEEGKKFGLFRRRK